MTGDTGAADRGFIDVNACFGPEHGMAGTAGAPLSTLVAERRAHGIHLTLAWSLLAAWADGPTGDRAAAEAAADPDNGVAAISCLQPRRTEDAARRVAEAERAGVVGYRLDGWTRAGGPAVSPIPPAAVEDTLRAVATTGRPLLVPIGVIGDASAIGAATADLGIPVILTGAHYTNVVDALAAAVRHPHLHLETCAMAHFRAIETAVRTIGAERVLFGTGSPIRAAASPISAILAAAIPDDAKRAILGGNAARLFGLPTAPIDLEPSRAPARAFDVHTHYGPFDFDVPDVADASLLDELRVPPASSAVASSAIAIFGDPERGNAQAALAAAEGETRGSFAYVVVDPADVAFSETQLRRYLDAPGFRGVKVHGEWSGVPTASRAMTDLFDLLARFGRPVKIHNTGVGWDTALGEIAASHPELPIIIAHGGLGTPSVEGARLAATHDNVYVEWSSSFADLRVVRAAVAIVPPERLLWGSDAPLLDPSFVLGTYADAGLPDGALDRIFWDNAAALFAH